MYKYKDEARKKEAFEFLRRAVLRCFQEDVEAEEILEFFIDVLQSQGIYCEEVAEKTWFIEYAD